MRERDVFIGRGHGDDPRWKYGIPSDSNANYAWIEHMISHLSQKGRMGFVLANGSMSSDSNNEGKIRQAILDKDLVEGIVALPGQLFYTVQIPVCLWFITKEKKQPGKTLFIDAKDLGVMVGRTQKQITEEDIKHIAATFERFRNGKDVDELGFAKAATLEEIAANNYVLTPGRYVGIKPGAVDSEPFEEKMARLTTELGGLFAESHKLEDEIRTKLEAIGYPVA